MTRSRLGWLGSVGVALLAVVLTAGTAFASVSFPNARVALPGNYAYNYSNSLDFTGTPGTLGFRLHEAYITDASGTQARVMYTKSKDGTSWSAPTKVSTNANADGSSLATTGQTVITGWFTGYTYLDPPDAARRLQVNVSTDNGATWGGVTNLTSSTGHVDYPIVAASTIGTTENVYAAWVDSDTCNVRFRQSSNGGGAWSSPITLGTTTAQQQGAGYGCSGYANISAVGNLISVVWISADDGTLKVRSIAAGSAIAPATLGNWKSTVTLNDKISTGQSGFPIASSSPLAEGVVTIAYNTNTAQKFTTFKGGATSATAAGTLVYTNGTIGGTTYAGGYSLAVEPAPGGYVAMWAGCRDVSITNPCNYANAKARFDLLEASSSGGAFTNPPVKVETASNTQFLNDEASMVVIPSGGSGVKVFAQYNAYRSNYGYYDVWMQIGTGTL